MQALAGVNHLESLRNAWAQALGPMAPIQDTSSGGCLSATPLGNSPCHGQVYTLTPDDSPWVSGMVPVISQSGNI